MFVQPPDSQGLDSSVGTPLGCVNSAKPTYSSNPRHGAVACVVSKHSAQ